MPAKFSLVWRSDVSSTVVDELCVEKRASESRVESKTLKEGDIIQPIGPVYQEGKE